VSECSDLNDNVLCDKKILAHVLLFQVILSEFWRKSSRVCENYLTSFTVIFEMIDRTIGRSAQLITALACSQRLRRRLFVSLGPRLILVIERRGARLINHSQPSPSESTRRKCRVVGFPWLPSSPYLWSLIQSSASDLSNAPDQDSPVHVMTIRDLIYLIRQQKKPPKGQLQSQHDKQNVAQKSSVV
jgi:hypothetical protein